MEYSMKEMTEISGLSGRTLRYYDSIGLLKPKRVSEAGYRFYGEQELALLQQILFYRERGFALEEIRRILYQADFDVLAALQEHLCSLEQRQQELGQMIQNVKQTIAAMKGEGNMKEKERFEGLKKRIVEENEAAYGKESRESYGVAAVEGSKKKLLGMSEDAFAHFQSLQQRIEKDLREAVLAKEDPAGEAGHRVALLHQEWLRMAWEKYSPKAHRGLVDLYVQDERFRDYYDKETAGCAAFLRAAVLHWVMDEE